ncbi:hypothetical protein IZY60_08830 [Lutibacter sp. B2]|nr:hypothetical protein [Lutibacter sp. B2]
MKKRYRGTGGLLIGFIVIGVMSGTIAFFMLSHNETKTEDLSMKIQKETPVQETLATKDSIKDILSDVKDVYIESAFSVSNIIELGEGNASEIIQMMEKLDVNLVMKSVEDSMKYNDCSYIIHIKSKNIKIKLNNSYIIVEEGQGGTRIYEVDDHVLKTLNKKVESLYMSECNKNFRFENAKEVTITAGDQNKEWSIKDDQLKELLSYIDLTTPVSPQEKIGICSKYPDYQLKIEFQKQTYMMKLINDNLMSMEALDNQVYYRYDKKLWAYIVEKYPVPFDAEINQLEYLVKSKNVVVDDMENVFDLEDDKFFPRELTRVLTHASKSEVAGVPSTENLMYLLEFSVDDNKRKVKVYHNYIEYEEKIYYSENIGELIKSVISV